MDQKLNVLLFGSDSECRAAVDILNGLEVLSAYSLQHHHLNDLEKFEMALVDWSPTLLLILADGAEGMECIYRAKERKPSIPAFWFSDDQLFGMQSYRLNCAYFSVKPVTEETLHKALQRCDRMGIRYTK